MALQFYESDTSLTLTACDLDKLHATKRNVGRNITFPIQETRCMQHKTPSHETPLHANVCLHNAIWLQRGRKQPCLTLHATSLHIVNPS